MCERTIRGDGGPIRFEEEEVGEEEEGEVGDEDMHVVLGDAGGALEDGGEEGRGEGLGGEEAECDQELERRLANEGGKGGKGGREQETEREIKIK